MNHPVIPAPWRFDTDGEQFRFHSGTAVAFTAVDLEPTVERFCADVRRRTGLRLEATAGTPGKDEPGVRIELTRDEERGAVPVPLGLSPTGDGSADESYSLSIDTDQVVVRAAEPIGIARGLTTLVQLLATALSTDAATVLVGGARIVDGPRYAWRGLSFDVVRASFSVVEIRRVIDLLALYKFNVLHLHLTDDQGWRLPVGRPATSAETDFYSADDLRELCAYAADRFVTIVPEVDTPGHASALVNMHPELNTARNQVQFELVPGYQHHVVWLDPDAPATFTVIHEVLAGVAAIFPGPFVHIGGDEPWGMPHDLYTSYVGRVREFVRSIGKRPLGWQESARAGLEGDDIIQYWFTEIALPESLPAALVTQLEADLALSHGDVERAAAAAVAVIVSPLSHCYFDVPYKEQSADPAQAERQGRVGLRVYPPATIAESFDWDPAHAIGAGRAAQVAGVEAAIWCETISDFDDLTFLLLPRLAGVAHKAWSDPQDADWAEHADRIARHSRLWAQDDLTYFRANTVNWI
jgi:hexosaminidase